MVADRPLSLKRTREEVLAEVYVCLARIILGEEDPSWTRQDTINEALHASHLIETQKINITAHLVSPVLKRFEERKTQHEQEKVRRAA